MIKSIGFALSISAALLVSCNNGGTGTTPGLAPAGNTADGKDFYFTYTVDGKEASVDAADISATYRVSNTGKVFSIYAGKEGGTQLLLTVPFDMAKPSVTPSGSPDYSTHITQGSISLQDYPEKGYTTNSFNSTYPEKSPVITDAIVITSTEKEGDVARIISGTFHATTYGEASGTDPKSSNHRVTGRFKIRHEFDSMNGGKF